MNTAFQRWGSKFGVLKVQLWQRKSCDFGRVLSAKYYNTFPDAGSGLGKIGLVLCRLRCDLLFSTISYSNKQCFRFLNVTKNRCWKCNAVVAERDLVCMSCGSVQEPNERLNYFEIFKETPHFDLDVRNLNVKFRRLQNLLHPDKIASRPEKEKEYSAEQSALVNKAYQTLSRPIDRGLYLLELHSRPLNEDEIQLPSDFLSHIMEVNERLEEGPSPSDLENIRHMNTAKIQMLFSDVSLAFKEKNIDKARESLCKLKYYINIDEKIRRLEEELGISRDD